MTGKRLEARRQDVDWGDAPLHSYCRDLYALAGLCANHPNDVRHRRACGHRHYPCNAVQVVVARNVRFTRSQVHPHHASAQRRREGWDVR
jgi:hypothetical protein